jgi:hypothetical protein
MNKVNSAQLTKIAPRTFATEASSLGWKPGHWPRMFEMDGYLYVRFGGDAGSVIYQRSGDDIDDAIMVEVFND